MTSGLFFSCLGSILTPFSDPFFILFGTFLERGVENAKTQIQPLFTMFWAHPTSNKASLFCHSLGAFWTNFQTSSFEHSFGTHLDDVVPISSDLGSRMGPGERSTNSHFRCF